MSHKTHKLVVKFDIHYDGERMAVERIEELQRKILDFGIQTMLASRPDSKPKSFSLHINHEDDHTIHDLVDQLEACGVLITGRDKVLALGSSDNWPADLARIAMVGVREGVRFFRAHEDVTNMQLDRILGRYPLSDEQRNAIVNNILLDPNAPKEPTIRVLRHQP